MYNKELRNRIKSGTAFLVGHHPLVIFVLLIFPEIAISYIFLRVANGKNNPKE